MYMFSVYSICIHQGQCILRFCGGKQNKTKTDRKLEKKKKKPDPQKAEWHNNQILTVATMISTFDHGQIGLTTPRPSLRVDAQTMMSPSNTKSDE